MIGGNARDKPFPYISFNSTVLLVVCMCSMCKFILYFFSQMQMNNESFHAADLV